MKRSTYKQRIHIHNGSQLNMLVPVLRRDVVPGTRVQGDVRIFARSQRYANEYANGGLLQAWAFYVPYRLLWSGWEAWLVGGAGTFPTTATAWPLMLDNSGTNSSLFRRAYKLAYNQYFGDSEVSYYADITNDSSATPLGLKTLDQFHGALRQELDMEQHVSTHDVTGSGTVAEIDMDTLTRDLRDYRSQRRRDQFGNKYVDLLRSMGVELDWRVQDAPEFLGSATKEVLPYQHDPDAQDALPFSRFSSSLQLGIKPTMCAEHGYIMVLAAFRPLAAVTSQPVPYDGRVTAHEQMYLGAESAMEDDVYSSGALGGVIGNMIGKRFEHYRRGYIASGANFPYQMRRSPSDQNELLYPATSEYNLATGSEGSTQMVWVGNSRLSVTAPI